MWITVARHSEPRGRIEGVGHSRWPGSRTAIADRSVACAQDEKGWLQLARLQSNYVRAPLRSVVQCGHFVALIGIDMVQAGQSFATGVAVGDGRFKLLIAFTTRKMQKATIRKLIRTVMKLP